MADSAKDVYHDAMDWTTALKIKEDELRKQRDRIDYLERLLDKRDDKIRMLRRDLSESEKKYEGGRTRQTTKETSVIGEERK